MTPWKVRMIRKYNNNHTLQTNPRQRKEGHRLLTATRQHEDDYRKAINSLFPHQDDCMNGKYNTYCILKQGPEKEIPQKWLHQ